MPLSEIVLDLLEQHERIETQFNATVYRTATEENRKVFKEWLNERYLALPQDAFDFIEFASIADGLNVNGLFVYSLKPDDKNSIYTMNELWWSTDDSDALLYLADDSLSWYVLDTPSKVYRTLSRPGMLQVEQFETFNEMIACALETAL